ncbi:MAG: DUF3391 domain-containing protein [Candidatus Marinimicrobia bacterium]|nr:DUF3391 domain-containing protein [Candidatus Neomarinimicrobiota bacterium]
MIRTVPSDDLKVGMYVILDVSWFRHSFPKSRFKISSTKQINRIIATGIKKVKVDTSKSDAIEESAASAITQGAMGGQTRESGEEKASAKARGGGTGTKSVMNQAGRQERLGTDPVIPQKAVSGGVGTDTVTLGDEKEFVDSGIDTVTLGDEKEFVDSGIDTISLGDEKEFVDSGIDTVTLGDEKEFVDSGIDTVTLGDEKEFVDSGIDTIKTERKDDWEDGGIDTVTPPPQELVPIDFMALELRETLHQSENPPRIRANAIYHHSLQLMESLLANPTAKNIAHGVEMIHDIVDQIMVDDEVANLIILGLSHDERTYTHSTNVGLLSILLAKAALKDSDDYDLVELGTGFYLHDLGKSLIPTQMLNKPGKLSIAEWNLVRMHPESGEKILAATSDWTENCARIILQHHERADGTGYPKGLSGDDIELSAQICGIADVYDALTSYRPYKEAPVFQPFHALEVIKTSIVNHYNAEIFKVFVSLFSK